MTKPISAIFEHGVLRPLTPLTLNEQEHVTIQVRRLHEDGSEELFDTEYADLCAAEADPSITLEEVREALSGIKGSLDDAINEDRGEY